MKAAAILAALVLPALAPSALAQQVGQSLQHGNQRDATRGGGGTGGVPAFSHIVVVVEENHDYSQIIGNTTNARYINSLAAGGALLTNYSAITHPSEPNYFALHAGSTFGVTDTIITLNRTRRSPLCWEVNRA